MNEKEKIKEILINSINSFEEDIKDYEMIGLIGSMAKEGDNFGDVDLVSIGNKKTHEKFKKCLIEKFQEKEIRIVFLKTILKESTIDKDLLMFHDLHYKDKKELLKKEWPTVTNTIIEDCLILYGKNLIHKESLRKVTKRNFLGPLFKWAKKIKNYEGYKIFQDHLLNISKIFERYGFNKELYNVKAIISSKENWRIKLVQIKNILK